MHSPFGALFPVIEKTGWKLHYITWGVSWATIQLIMADQPAFARISKSKPTPKPIAGKELAAKFFS